MNLSLSTASAWAGAAVDTPFDGFGEAMPTGDEATADQNHFRSPVRPPLASPKPKLVPSILERSARTALAPLAFMGLVGCSASWEPIDNDGDGYSVAQGDCWDNPETSPGNGIPATEVHPGAADVPCDDVDQDCDGADATLTRYDDIDSDGYGDLNFPVATCVEPAGTVTNADDCDDRDAALNPAATETCDGVDQNCNGEIDEDATDMQEWYTDSDGDGYGSTGSPQVVACDAPIDGDVTNANDCDDTSGDVHPYAEETCNDVDDDCDTEIDEDLPLNSFYTDADADGYGDPDAEIQDCSETVPEGTVTDATDCDDADTAVNPAATEICDNVDNNCDGTVDDDATDRATFYADADGDGYGDGAVLQEACTRPSGTVTNANDCDDAAADVHPYGTEVCNGVDDDCDGDADSDAMDRTTWYADADGDTYGNAAVSTLTCDSPLAYVANANDCDDTDDEINPDAIEVCDGADNDCSGDADSDASDRQTWYEDADGDTYGNVAVSTLTCDSPLAYVANASDCDDTDDEINPAAVEVCDGADNDCSGDADSDASDAQEWYEDADGDGEGNASSTEAACDQPLGFVATADDCDDANTNTYPGASEVFDGAVNDCDSAATTEGPFDITSGYPRLVGEQAGDELSFHALMIVIPYVGDMNGDGYGEVLIAGALANYDGLSDAGIVYAISAATFSSLAVGDTDIGSARLAQWVGEEDNQQVGSNVAAAGDYNGDGYADIWVGAPYKNSYAGEAYLIAGGSSLSGDYAVSASAVVLSGDVDNDTFGYAFISADFDGDGLDDGGIASLSTPPESIGFYYAGTLSSASTLTKSDADLSFTGSGSRDYLGIDMDAQDFDGDGTPDLLVGATATDGVTGKSYLVLDPNSLPGQPIETAASLTISGDNLYDVSGRTLVFINDLPDDGDGLPEIGVGAFLSDNTATDDGSFSVFYSSSTGTAGAYALNDADITLVGDSASAGFGISSDAVDLTDDGVDDILVGTRDDDSATFFDGSLLTAGTYYTSTPNSAFTTFNGADQAGYSVGLIPVSSGTGYALIGSYGYDAATGTDAGSVTVVEKQ